MPSTIAFITFDDWLTVSKKEPPCYQGNDMKVTVEANVASGIPSFTIVKLTNNAVRESSRLMARSEKYYLWLFFMLTLLIFSRNGTSMNEKLSADKIMSMTRER
jgi:hypothetical protein